MSIKTRLAIILFTFSLIPSVFIGLLMLENGRSSVEMNALSALELIAELKKAELLEFLHAKEERAVDFSSDARVREGLKAIRRAGSEAKRLQEGRVLGRYLSSVKKPLDNEIIELHLLDVTGKVVASTDEGFIGRDESSEPYFREGLESSSIQDVSLHSHGGRQHHYIPVSAPVREGAEALGVLMNGYSVRLADDIISGERLRHLGQKPAVAFERLPGLDIFLVNGSGLLLTGSRSIPQTPPLETRVDTAPVVECIASGRDMRGRWTDMSGSPVWGASDCFTHDDGLKWTIIVEQDESVALAMLSGMNYLVLLIILSVSLVAGFISYATALSITGPIGELKKGASILATGNLDYRIRSREKDELGALARSFDDMAEDLLRVTASRDELQRETAERKRAIEALRISETKYKNLVETSLAGIYRSNFKGDLLFANSSLAAMFEFDSPEEMTREGMLPRYRDMGAREDLLNALREKGRVEAFEFEALTKTGRTKTVLMSATLLGNIISGTVLDITELRRARELRREAEKSKALANIDDSLANVVTDYQGVLDTIARYIGDLVRVPCVIRLISKDGRWLEALAFYHPDPAMRELLSDFIASNPLPADTGLWGQVVRDGAQASGAPEEAFRDIKPEYLPVVERLGIRGVLVTPLRAEGRVIGVIACFRPGEGAEFTSEERILIQDLADRAALAISIARLIREIRSYSAELERSNTELQQFAYVASHDLKEPLRMIDGYLKLLDRKYAESLDDKAKRYIRFASSGTTRMQGIIDDLLEYSRVSARARVFEHTDAQAVLSAVLENLSVLIRESGARIERGRLPAVTADPVQLSQVFQNLISNAIKFRRPDRAPVVRISAGEREGEWLFTVEDNGIGIDPKYREKVFEIFQRVHGQEFPGTGIGLAICKRVVERHGGRIWVASEPGAGSTFYFTIPKRDAAPGQYSVQP